MVRLEILTLHNYYILLKIISDSSAYSWGASTTSILLWTMNILVMLMCMIKVLVYGDPLLGSETQASDAYWKHKKLAEHYFSTVRIITIRKH